MPDYPYHGVVGSYPIYTADEVIQRGRWIKNRNPFYSQGVPPYKGERGTYMQAASFDCSSFIGTITGYAQALGGAPATPSMASDYMAYGYTPLSYVVAAASGLKKGDVLVYNKPGTSGAFSNGHTAMYIGDGQVIEMTGRGCLERGLYGWSVGNWQWVLRNPKSGFYPVKWDPA